MLQINKKKHLGITAKRYIAKLHNTSMNKQNFSNSNYTFSEWKLVLLLLLKNQ